MSVGAFTVGDEVEEGARRCAARWSGHRCGRWRPTACRGARSRGGLGSTGDTVEALGEADEPPRYSRAPAGSMLDPLEPVLRRLIEDWPEIRAPRVTRDPARRTTAMWGRSIWFRRRLAVLRPRRRAAGAADGLSAGAGAAGRLGRDADAPEDRRARAPRLRADLLACRSRARRRRTSRFDMTIESFLEGHVRAFDWLGGVPRECVYDNLRSAVARRDARRRSPGTRGSRSCAAITPSTRRLHAGDAAREGRRRGRGPLPEDRVLAGAAVRGPGRAGRALRRLARPGRAAAPARDRRLHGVAERLALEREQLRPLPPIAFDAAGRRSHAGPGRWLPEVRPQLLPRPGGADPAARRAALGPRPGLDRPPRRHRRPLRAQL